MEELLNCPKCNGPDFENFYRCKDYTVSGEYFYIISCKSCSFKFTNPRPGIASIGKYYESEDYVSHSNTNKGLINKIYHFIKKIAINKKIELLNSHCKGNKKLLDIGCGTGSFLGIIKDHGWNVCGIEPNDKAREMGINSYQIPVYGEEKIKNFSPESFSAITMWHVLEHVHNLKERINEIYNLLEKNGVAVIAVPNYTSWDAKHYKSNWAAFDVPRHLYHFSPDSIKDLFKEVNLHHVKSYPMKFDSFYVSMLSEKYKNSSLKLIRAFFNGMWSNLKAKNDAEKYSSVIYVFQKN